MGMGLRSDDDAEVVIRHNSESEICQPKPLSKAHCLPHSLISSNAFLAPRGSTQIRDVKIDPNSFTHSNPSNYYWVK